MICLIYLFCLLHFVHCQEADLPKFEPIFYRDEGSQLRFCDENACLTVHENKTQIQYENMEEECSERSIPHEWLLLLISGVPIIFFIGMIIGIVMVYIYTKYIENREVKSVSGFIKAVLMREMGTGSSTRNQNIEAPDLNDQTNSEKQQA